METNQSNEVIAQENFTLLSNKNKSFSLIIQNKNSSIFISVYSQAEIGQRNYTNEFSFEELKKNRYLSIHESINEVYEEITNLIKKKNKDVKLIEKENKIEINIPLENIKVKEIILNLNEKEKNEKELINDLYIIISNLKQENKDLKENQKKLEEKINYLENDIKSWKEYKEKIDKKEKEKKKKK